MNPRGNNPLLLLFLAMLASLSACCCLDMYDDPSKCPYRHILFSYTADGKENVLAKYIRNGVLYLYHEDGRLAYEQQLTTTDLRRGITLPKVHSGRWRVVVWGNMGKHTKVAHQESLGEGTLETVADAKGIYGTTDSLYYANTMIDLDTLKPQENAVVAFASAHVSFDIVIKGFDAYHNEEAREDCQPTLQITKAGTRYPFGGHSTSIPQPTEFTSFCPKLAHSASQDLYRARFDLLRFDEIQDITLTLCKGGASAPLLSTIPLHDYLASQNILLKGKHEVNIPILIAFSGQLDVVIKPFEWGSVDILPDGFKVH